MERMEDLIEKSRAGDRQAQEALVRAVQDQVYYHCDKMLRNPEDARDAAQEILISMLSGLEGLRQPAAFRSWLSRLTSNVCFRWISRSRRECLLWEDMDGCPPPAAYENFDDQTVPDKALDNEETRRMVVELVDSLPEAQRLSVLFYYYDEMSVKEIAEAMETTEGTVKSRLHYAREAIRKGVERYTAQGIKLYGLTPVPFLQYFLQKESVSAAAAMAGRAALAASAATAAGNAAAAGAAKILGGVLTRKGAAVLAGLTVAGIISGGVFLRMDRPEEAPSRQEPAALTEVVSYEKAEEEAALPPEPSPVSELPPAPEQPVWTPPVWMGESPAPDETETPQEEEQLLMVVELSEALSEIQPEPHDEEMEVAETRTPEPEPEREERNDRAPDRDEDDGGDVSPAPDPEPAPGPDPEPSEPDQSIPPAASVQYKPDPDFWGDYLGETPEGVHEFLYSVRMPDETGGQCPLLPGNYYSQMEVGNSTVVITDGKRFWGGKTGQTDIRFFVSEKKEGPYQLKALVHLEVFSLEPIRPGPGYLISGLSPEGAFLIDCEIPPDGKDQPAPLDAKGLEIMLESSDPAVAGVREETGRFYGIAPGAAEIRAYTRNPHMTVAPWELQAVFRLTVIQPVELTEGAKLCAPVEDFSPQQGAAGCTAAAYQGVNAQRGIYEFEAAVREGDVFRLQPLAEGPYETRTGISNGLIAFENLDEGTYRAVRAGFADVVFYANETLEGTFTECAVVHVTISPRRPPYDPNPAFGEFLGSDEAGVFHFRAKVEAGGPGLPCPLLPTPDYFRALSDDPAVAVVRDGTLYGLSGGSTTVRYFVSAEEESGYELAAVASVEVTAPEPSDPPEPSEPPLIPPEAAVTEMDFSEGYGYSYAFRSVWKQGTLPASLVFRSSDPAIICVNERGGFTTMSPGTARVAAWDPDDPSVYYVMNVQVENHFDWGATIRDMEVFVGETAYHTFSSRWMDSEVTLERIDWASSDPSVVTAGPGNYTTQCSLLGHQAGTATVSGTVYFSLITAAGRLETMTDTVSFQVTVVP